MKAEQIKVSPLVRLWHWLGQKLLPPREHKFASGIHCPMQTFIIAPPGQATALFGKIVGVNCTFCGVVLDGKEGTMITGSQFHPVGTITAADYHAIRRIIETASRRYQKTPIIERRESKIRFDPDAGRIQITDEKILTEGQILQQQLQAAKTAKAEAKKSKVTGRK